MAEKPLALIGDFCYLSPNGRKEVTKHRKRLTKKELKEDRVAEFFVDTAQYVRDNTKKVAGVAVLVAIVALIAAIAMRERRAAEIEAKSWMARADLDLKQGNVSSALQAYSGIMDRFRGTWSHSDATFFAANAEFATGRTDTALVLFERYLGLKKRRREFTVSAKQGIAQCLEETGRYRDAAESYLKVQREHPESPLAPDALFAAGRCYELAGDLRLAESAYSDLVGLYPNSNQANLVKLPLLEIQAKLENT
jgi:outer membrane protein assembly factor BamD (BamD/ComL family)